jgi:hypothetical protein
MYLRFLEAEAKRAGISGSANTEEHQGKLADLSMTVTWKA